MDYCHCGAPIDSYDNRREHWELTSPRYKRVWVFCSLRCLRVFVVDIDIEIETS